MLPNNSKRLFVAIPIIPNNNFISFLNTLKAAFCLDKITWTSLGNMHITLCFIGETNNEIIPSVITELRAALQRSSKATIILNSLGYFGKKYQPKVLWLKVNPENSFQECTERIFKNLNAIELEPLKVNFVPHLTLGRIKTLQDKKLFFNIVEQYKNNEIQIIDVDTIYLYESVLEKGKAPIYKEIEAFKLL